MSTRHAVDGASDRSKTRARTPRQDALHRDAAEGVISSRKIATFSALLWAVAALIGALAILFPHGGGVPAGGWVALTVFAAVMAVAIALVGERQPPWAYYALSVVAVAAVSVAVITAHRSSIEYAVCSLYLLPTIFAASFYPRRVFLLYVMGQGGLAAGVLFSSGIAGAPAAWVFVIGTTSTIGFVVHVLQRELRLAATTDPLTGLLNRRAFESVLIRELSRCARLDHPLSLVAIDLDRFKDVNDELGHCEGDKVLIDVSAAWSRELRQSDILARSGGDEFVLLLPSTGWAQAMDVLARLSRSSSYEFSAGIAVAEPGSSLDEVMRRADDACYEAKRTGRGQVVLAEGGSQRRSVSGSR